MARNVQIIDGAGNTRDWAWLRAKYGNVTIEETPADGYHVVQIVECVSGWMGFTASFLNEAGGPVAGLKVAYDHGAIDHEVTRPDGIAEHIAGDGEKYDPRIGQTGPVTWYAEEFASDKLHGIGWLVGTFHEHLQVTMRWNGSGGGGEATIAAALDRMTAQFKKGIKVTILTP